jgi:hypothetical protein
MFRPQQEQLQLPAQLEAPSAATAAGSVEVRTTMSTASGAEEVPPAIAVPTPAAAGGGGSQFRAN